MTEIEFLQAISNEVCPDCSSDRDCGLEYEDCDRIYNALELLHDLLDGKIKLEI